MTTRRNGPPATRPRRARRAEWAPLVLLLALGLALGPAPGRHVPVAGAQAVPAVYYGAYVPNGYQNMALLNRFERNAGKPLALLMWYQGWGQTDGHQDFHPEWLDKVRARGTIPMITWEPWAPGATANQPPYALRAIAAGAFDAYIDRWASAARAWGKPFFLRFAHEMNGNWTSWSEQTNGNRSGDFVAAWRHVHDRFAAQGAANVTWVWCPNVEYPNSTPLEGLYPGDAYVDWICVDGYNFGTTQAWGSTWQSFAQVFGPTYDRLLALQAGATPLISPAKPLMIGETASAEPGGSKAGWITDAYRTQLPGAFPRVKAVVWFNEVSRRGRPGSSVDWRIESSRAAQNAFAGAVAGPYYATNSYAALGPAPIPPP